MSWDWRLVALAGLAVGLGVSPAVSSDVGTGAVVALAVCVMALALARSERGVPALIWAVLLAFACAVAGLLLGTARIRSIDARAYSPPSGTHLGVRGHVSAVPRRSAGTVRVRVETPRGRLAVEAPEPVPDLPVGAEVSAVGSISAPQPWLRDDLRRHGISRILRASRIDLTGGQRGGLARRIDRLRTSAEEALGRGMPDEQAALARGFVLGQDDRIEPRTIEEFRRSGLAHLLAVSGQNVVLLALLAAPMLAALGIPLRARLGWLIALIAVYVPLAGGGASIQRAGVMGVAAVVAMLAGRPASRTYALLLAAVVTLLLNPRASSDVGWQLSFAAVAGIFVWGAPLRQLLLLRLGGGGWQRGLADGIAVTVAATLATAPLMAHHFGELSVTSLLANVLALPAVAPAMWLGMLVAGLGQFPAIPVEPLNWLNSLFLAYIGQIATWMGGPKVDPLVLPASNRAHLVAAYLLLFGAGIAFRGWASGRLELRLARLPSQGLLRLGVAVLGTVAVAVTSTALRQSAAHSPAGLRISVLDVGQGDAILFQPSGAAPVLVDGGPPGAELREKLDRLGVRSLAAVVLSHDQSDHAGGVMELLGHLGIDRLVYANASSGLLGAARAAGAVPTRLAAGSGLRSGSLRLEVLWPPRELLGVPSEDPNPGSLVLLARWGRFEMLLPGDAEAEAVPIDPGPVDVLKVSHHGSADAGLPALLNRTMPRLAVVSVGEDNPFGHPVASTLGALSRRRVNVLRTDRDGTVTIDVGTMGTRVAASH